MRLIILCAASSLGLVGCKTTGAQPEAIEQYPGCYSGTVVMQYASGGTVPLTIWGDTKSECESKRASTRANWLASNAGSAAGGDTCSIPPSRERECVLGGTNEPTEGAATGGQQG